MENKCEVCGTEENLIRPYINDFVRVCEEHKEYRADFQFDKIKLQFGYINRIPDAICAICEKQLSSSELESIDRKDFTKTCNEHRWMSHFYSFHQFSEQYKAGLPFTSGGKVYSKECPKGA